MRSVMSRWFMFGLLLGWALTHATGFAQPGAKGKAGASAIEKLRAALDKEYTFDYTGQSLTEVLNHFRDKTGIAINVDQMALMQIGMDMPAGVPGGPGGGVFPGAPGGGGGQVQLKATNEKASSILRKLLDPHQLTYIIFQDAVLITTEESALMRQMRQRVSVNLADAAFDKSVRDLAKNHGINLVIDPKVAKDAQTTVTLQLDNTSIETTVRLLAELANLKAVRMGNVMFITTEEKATKIRKEEPQQFDNPFNPNLPVPGIMRGGIGFGAVMPMPARVAPGVAQPQVVPPDVPPPAVDPAVPNRPVQDLPKKGATTPAPRR